MKSLKDLKWNSILTSIILIVIGLILIIAPDTTARTICYIAGGALAVTGAFSLIGYFSRPDMSGMYGSGLVTGVIEVLVGIFFVVRSDVIISIIPFIMGVCVTISGIGKLQNALNLKRMHYDSSTMLLALAVINVILGFVLMWNPFTAAKVLFIVIGAGLVYSGVTDLITTLYVSKKIHKYKKDTDPIDVDGKFID